MYGVDLPSSFVAFIICSGDEKQRWISALISNKLKLRDLRVLTAVSIVLFDF